MKSRLIISLLLLFVIFNAYSQNVKKALKNADGFYEQALKEQPALFEQAIPAYLEVLKIEPNHLEANYKLGISYMNTRHKLKGLPYLEKAAQLNPQVSPDLNFHLGKARQLNHQFDKAKEAFTAYKKTINPKDLERIQLLDRKIF